MCWGTRIGCIIRCQICWNNGNWCRKWCVHYWTYRIPTLHFYRRCRSNFNVTNWILWLYELCLSVSFSSSIFSIVSSFLDDFLALLRRFPIVDCFFLANCYGLLLWMVILLRFCMVILVHDNPWDYNPCECLSFQIWYEILYNENPCEWSLNICTKLLLNDPY